MSTAPITDKRRASALRAAMAEMAPWLAPEWAGLGHERDFGRALLEIAARLAEHSTRRLDDTPLRDKLAFLNMLEIAAPAPRSATVPIVFSLAEKRKEPLYAPPRVQIAASVDGKDVMFETREAIAITPARVLRLIAADPESDRIELAPAAVTADPKEGEPPVTYRLASAAETDGTMLQLAQAVGLAPGDLLRIGGIAYRIAKLAREIVTLADPLEAPAPEGTSVEKVMRLEAFTLRSLTQHVAYIGHKELLKLDGPATITLRLDPPGLVRRLSQLDVEFTLWAKQGNDAPAWQPLRLLGGEPGRLRLLKEWQGSAEEEEVAGRKNRWIRLRLRTPISDSEAPDTRTLSLDLQVESNMPAPSAGAAGSRTIVSAFYNGLPLPLTTAFYPFGTEPQRFDTFALAAPEALSKKDATVTLTISMSDASIEALATIAGAAAEAYGIGHNGRLQLLTPDSAGAMRWRQLADPTPVGVSADTPSQGVRLDPARAFHAVRGGYGDPNVDLVFGADPAGVLWMARVLNGTTQARIIDWAALTQPSDTVADFALIHDNTAALPLRLLTVGDKGFQQRLISWGGVHDTPWTPVATIPAGLDTSAFKALAPAAGGVDRKLAIVDAGGAVYRAQVAADYASISWARLSKSSDPKVDAAIRPASAVDSAGSLHVAAAERDSGALLMFNEGKAVTRPPGSQEDVTGKPVSILCQPDVQDTVGALPIVVATGKGGVLIWPRPNQAQAFPLPAEARTASIPCGALLSAAGVAGAYTLLLSAGGETLLHTRFDLGRREVAVAWWDSIWAPATAAAADYVVFEKAPHALVAIGQPWLDFGAHRTVPTAPGSLKATDKYRLLARASKLDEFAGTLLAATKKAPARLQLDKADKLSATGGLLMIGTTLHTITSLSKGAARLDPPPTASAKYTRLSLIHAGTVDAEDVGTLVRLPDATNQPEETELQVRSSASPSIQAIAYPDLQPDDEIWLRLTERWTVRPTASTASLLGPPTIDSWSEAHLPRGADNPDLSWEYFDGEGWRRLDRGFRDGTFNFARSGEIEFKVPRDVQPTDVAGKTDYWIRARLVGGDYGRPTYVVDTKGTRQSITVDRSQLNPPELLNIEASYVLDKWVAPQVVLTLNNLTATDQSQAAAAAGASFDLFQGIAAHVGDAPGAGRALYLGLTRAPGVDALNLYVDAEDRNAEPLRLKAEALTPEGWVAIPAEDETAGLTRPGLLRLFLSTEPAQLPLFGSDGWWLRLRPRTSRPDWSPVLRGLWLNAAMAEQAKSLRQELLGSSLGEPDQRFTLAEPPVLPETLELRIRESLGDEDKSELRKTDPDAVTTFPEIDGEWVRWCSVESFVDQDGDARVFRLDPAIGELRFGNGRNGKIPPAGRDAIRAVGYQSGGGAAGNVSAFAVKQLKSALESVELAVNPVDAGGGADSPARERLAATAPARLRHAGRALTPIDIEALATGSSPDIVRARCLRGRGCAIDLAVAIRHAGQRCPVPSRARREGIARSIAACGWGAFAPDAIRVRAPAYVHVKVEAVVSAKRSDGVAEVENTVRKAIVDFLHPVEGGPGGLGWPFGRRPWPSDVQRVAAAVAGVDRIVDVSVAARDQGDDLDRLAPDALICAEEKDIRLLVQPPRNAR